MRFGQYTVFLPLLLKPAPTRLRLVLWSLAESFEVFPEAPPPGLVTVAAVPDAPPGYYPRAGYRLAGERAIRIDMLERLADMIRNLDARAGFEATPEMLSITGLSLEQFAKLMQGLGYVATEGTRPKRQPAARRRAGAEPPIRPPAPRAADARRVPDAPPTRTIRGRPSRSRTLPVPEPQEVPAEPGRCRSRTSRRRSRARRAGARPPDVPLRPDAAGGARRRSRRVPIQPSATPATARPRPAEAARRPRSSISSSAASAGAPDAAARAERRPRERRGEAQGQAATPRRGGAPGQAAPGRRRPQAARRKREERRPAQARPPRPEKPIDPDNPFAALMALKLRS